MLLAAARNIGPLDLRINSTLSTLWRYDIEIITVERLALHVSGYSICFCSQHGSPRQQSVERPKRLSGAVTVSNGPFTCSSSR